MARDINEVIRRIVAVIPDTEADLLAGIERVKRSAVYHAPELRHFDWAALQEVLAAHDATLTERPDWLDRAGKILAGQA